MSDNNLIKELRELTGAGIMDVKEALAEGGDDRDKALEILRKKGIAKLGKKADRIAKEGIIESYIHAGGRIGALVELNCETDFVARTEDFQNLAKELALHIAASNPLYVNREEVPSEVVEKELEIYKEQIKDQVAGKPEEIVQKMLTGKLDKYYQESCLLEQSFVKDPDKKISDLIAESTAKMGENVQVRRFSRFHLGN